MYTTTSDLHAFWDSLLSARILSSDLMATYLETHYGFNETDGYGCGVYKRLDNSMFSIVGGDAGVGFDSMYSPREMLTINILSNLTNGDDGIRQVILEFL